MKRFLCLLVSLVLFAATALADDFDLSAYTSEQLTAIRDLINEELSRRAVSEGEIPSWFDYGMAIYAPNPDLLFGREVSYKDNVFGNTSNTLVAKLDDCTEEEYNKYVDAIIKYGFTDVINREDRWYEAKNAEGVEARIVYIKPDINISITNW